MNAEPEQWIQAEENFHKWIENPKLYPENPDSNIRKSIHIYFRIKYYNLLTPIVKWVFEELPLDDLLGEEIEEKEEEPLLKDSGIRFRLPTTSEINERILSGFWKDDRKTIYDFYEDEFSKVAWLIMKNSGTIEDAKDVFQDALVILMDKFTWRKLDLNCSLGTYVYSISRNLWMETLRRRKKENVFTDIEYYDTIEVSTEYYKEEPDIFPLVAKTIETLGSPCKELLELYYFENHSWETIASIMNYSNAASARNQKYKCMEKIREMVNKQ